METYKENLALTMAEIGAIFFEKNLVLKDGRPTPYFVNMAMFKTGRLSLKIGSFFADMMVSQGLSEKTDIVLGPSYKGSSIALATVISLWKDHGCDLLFEYDRKEAKTHGEVSGSGSLFVNKTFFEGCRVFIVDDVATSMRTKYDLLEKIEDEAKATGISINILGVGIGIDREQTTAVYDEKDDVVLGKKGRNAIQDFSSKGNTPVFSVAGIREVVDFLFKEKVPVLINGKKKPIGEKTKMEFDKYFKTYGND